MDEVSAREFASRWLDAWNSHDLEAILGHFTDDVVFTSPLAARLVEGSNGVVRGRSALREYWAEGLRRTPDLHFELRAVYLGVETLVINYVNRSGGLVCEVLRLRDGRVCEGHATYSAD